MLRALALLLLVLAAGCAATPDPKRTAPDYAVTLSRAGETWVADYRFTRAAPAWFFPRSRPTEDGRRWRPLSWTVETPGVRLEHRGRYDVLTADRQPLRAVRIRVRPFTSELQADYTPVLRYSDGALAHFSEHYEVMPLTSPDAAQSLPVDLNIAQGLTDAQGALTVRDPGRRLLVSGRVSRGEVTLPVGGRSPGVYVYSGDSPIVQTEALAAVFDPGLPAWLRGELEAFTPRLLELYTERMGPPRQGRPMVFAAWGGPAFQGASLGGSVLPGLVVMDLSGARLTERSARAVDRVHWFLGHEAAHFWLGQTLRPDQRNASWISEGGANLLAVRALQHLGSPTDARAELQSYVDGCVKRVTPGRPLEQASLIGANEDGHYTCGALLLLAAESALKRREPGADAFTFIQRLITASGQDREVTAEEWVAAMQTATGDAQLSADIRRFLRDGVPDTRAFLESLFTRTGVPHTRKGESLTLL